MFKLESVRFHKDPALWKEFTSSRTGTVGSDIHRRGRKLAFLAKQSVGKKTGRLYQSISVEYFPASNPWVRVGSNVRHAYMHHEGTRAHVIQESKQETMRFTVRGRVVYATRVVHPGTKPNRYLSKHLRKVVND